MCIYFCFFRILQLFIEYFLDVTKTPILMWHINPVLQPGGSGVGLSPLQSRLQSDKCDIFSCNSVRSILCEIWDACLDQVVAGCHRGYDIWYNRLTKLLRGGEGRGGEGTGWLWCHWFISVVTAGRPEVFLSYRGVSSKNCLISHITLLHSTPAPDWHVCLQSM